VKHFGRVTALNGANIEVGHGEIHGLVGDNGSGKTTLVKSLIGIHGIDDGEIFVRGEPTSINSPKEARRQGIATVYQDLALVDELTIAGNVFLGRELTKGVGPLQANDWGRMNERASDLLENRLNIHLDPTQRVEFLSGGERQAVAIARALVTDPELVIMDEPTSALSTDSASRVNELISSLKENGISVLLINHNIDEVFDLTDRISVLHQGTTVGVFDTENVTQDQLIRLMIEGSSENATAASA